MKKNKAMRYSLISILILFVSFIVIKIVDFIRFDNSLKSIEDAQSINKINGKLLDVNDKIKIFTWNTGYGNFKNSKTIKSVKNKLTDKEYININYQGIKGLIFDNKYDIILLQESSSKFIKMFSEIYKKKYSFFFAFNLKDVVLSPEGLIDLGLSTITPLQMASALRLKLPGKMPFPFNLITFKRCLLETRFPYKDKELVIYNVHTEFFDVKEKIRTEELRFIKEKILHEFNKGNYVIAGGDWNLILPGVERDRFKPWTTAIFFTNFLKDFHKGWTPEGWHWAYPKDMATMRTSERIYEKGKNYTTIFDGFILSPNIEIINVTGINLDFEYSDHQPVSIEIKLK